jgi:glycosyltransferase involved in cell wall biosynthesis
MRIGVDARPLSYQLTGIGFYLRSLLDTIQKIDKNNYYFLLSNTTIDFNLKNSKWTKVEGPVNKKILSTPWMQLRGPLIARKLDLDLFWSPRHHLPVAIANRIKTVLTIHDIVHHYYPSTMTLQNFVVERLLMRWSLMRSHRVITDSKSTESDLQRVYGISREKITTIHPGIPNLTEETTNLRTQEIDFPSKYFLFVGTLEPRKNFNRILKSFSLLNPEQYDVHLLVVGKQGWKTHQLADVIRRNPLTSNIHLMGYVSRKTLKTCYEKAVCLLFPSLYEGFGFPILEAMSCGTPVITSNVSSMPEIAGNAAIKVNPFDPIAITRAMKDVLENSKLRNHLRTRSLERVKQFSWLKCGTETIRVFETIAAI